MPGIGQAVRSVLIADSAMASILGDRVFPADAVDDTTAVPYAEYVVAREDEERALEGTLLGYDAEVTVTFITKNYTRAQQCLYHGRRILNAMRGSIETKAIDAAQVTDGSDSPSGPVERDDAQVFQADLTVGILYRE